MRTETPGELQRLGYTTLPCGFPLASKFLLRLKHYAVCPDPYCKGRHAAATTMGRALAADMARQAKAKRGGR